MLKEKCLRIMFAMGIGFLTTVEVIAQPSLGLPWKVGQVWKVSQGYHSSFGSPSGYSVDFNINSTDDTTEIVASADGIAYAKETPEKQSYCASNTQGYTWRSPFRWIELDYGNGWKIIYAHLNGFASGLMTGSGVRVVKGQVIGYLGNSGCTYTAGGGDGTHLDYTIT